MTQTSASVDGLSMDDHSVRDKSEFHCDMESAKPQDTVFPPPQPIGDEFSAEKLHTLAFWKAELQRPRHEITIKFLRIFLIGFALYYAATRYVWAFFSINVGFPVALFILNYTIPSRPFFGKLFYNTWMRPVKYMTFVCQNAACTAAMLKGSNHLMSQLTTWSLRVNVAEVTLDLFMARQWAYLAGSGYLLHRFYDVVIDDQYLMRVETDMTWFIYHYTLWFVGWITTRKQNNVDGLFLFITHTIFPLCVPPELWFSVRTVTGGFVIVFSSTKIGERLITNPKWSNDVRVFAEVYSGLYPLFFIAGILMEVFINIDFPCCSIKK